MVPFLGSASGLDETLFRALNLAGTNAAMDVLMMVVTLVGASYVIALLAVPLWWRGHREAAFDFLILLGITIVVTEALKFLFLRARPCEPGVLPGVRTIVGYGCDAEFDPSFPSGHASRAFALAAFVAVRYRWRAGGAATAFAALVGVSRIYLGVHWPSDVLAGALLGVGLALAFELASPRLGWYQRLRARLVAAFPHRTKTA